MDASRSWVGRVASGLLGMLTAAAGAGEMQALPSTTQSEAHMKTYASFLNELSSRRRRAVYFDNPQSLFNGATVGYVNAGVGNLTFARRDLVVPGPVPIVVQRVYDSRNGARGDFGAGGWTLSLAERIEPIVGGRLRYITATADVVTLVADGSAYLMSPARPTDISRVVTTDDGSIVVSSDDGFERRFEKTGQIYLLASVSDRFANMLQLGYDVDRRLRQVTGGDGARVDIVRDGDGRIVAIGDEAGRRVAYRYDNVGRLAAVTDRGGRIWRYEYGSDHRLGAALAPDGALDIAVRWNVDGRVDTALTDGIERRYRYDIVDARLTGLNLTRITDDAGRSLTLGQNALGITTYSSAPSGIESRLTLNARSAVTMLTVNGAERARYGYDDDGYMVSALQRGDGQDATAYAVDYDAERRLEAVRRADGSLRLNVERARDGRRIEVRLDGVLRVHRLDRRGLMTRLDIGRSVHYEFGRDARGRISAVTDDSGRSAGFEWSAAGTLASVRYADGVALDYRYSATGLRESAERRSGGLHEYRYTPSGNLYQLVRRTARDAAQTSTYQLEIDDRVRRLVRGEDVYRFDYSANGDLRAVTWDDGTLSFDYDRQGRFHRVQFNDEAPLVYRYRQSEPDLRLQADFATRIVARGRIDTDLTFANYSDVVLDRSMATRYGPVGFDAAAGTFNPVYALGVPVPGETEIAALIRTRLIAPDGVSAAITGGAEIGYGRFNAPSNPLFVPPEYRSLNCFFCPPSLPFAVPHRTAPSDDDASFNALAIMADALNRCGVGEYEPPADCSLDVSGLPAYLCNLQQAQIGATLSPSNLNENAVTWSIQGALVQVPVGDKGPTTGVRGASTVNASGSVRASFGAAAQLCNSPTLALPVRANEALSFAQVINPNACPERQQDADQLHEIDGCSIPPITTLIFPGDVQNPVGGVLNLPGTSTAFGGPQAPLAFGAAPLNLPCNRHDVCYQTCGNARLGCDNAMLDDMHAVCGAAYPDQCPHPAGSPACILYFNEQVACIAIADTIFQGLNLFAAPPWQQRQVQYCDCCPP